VNGLTLKRGYNKYAAVRQVGVLYNVSKVLQCPDLSGNN